MAGHHTGRRHRLSGRALGGALRRRCRGKDVPPPATPRLFISERKAGSILRERCHRPPPACRRTPADFAGGRGRGDACGNPRTRMAGVPGPKWLASAAFGGPGARRADTAETSKPTSAGRQAGYARRQGNPPLLRATRGTRRSFTGRGGHTSGGPSVHPRAGRSQIARRARCTGAATTSWTSVWEPGGCGKIR